MTYRSESRGMMYTAPPEDDVHDVTDDETDEMAEETNEIEERAPDAEPSPATTDANWTGSVPADD